MLSKSTAKQLVASADDWVEHADGEGRPYFINSMTGESSWERPASTAASTAVSQQGLLQRIRAQFGSSFTKRTTNPLVRGAINPELSEAEHGSPGGRSEHGWSVFEGGDEGGFAASNPMHPGSSRTRAVTVTRTKAAQSRV